MKPGRSAYGLVAMILTAALFVTVDAHDAHVAGPYRLVIGWSDEPAFTGIRNAVVVEVTETGKGPITDPASLAVEVSFGAERIVLPLTQDPARRHVFQAPLVPTRAGTYTFHITGRVKSQPIDITAICSEKTFDCVIDGSDDSVSCEGSAGGPGRRTARPIAATRGAGAGIRSARTTNGGRRQLRSQRWRCCRRQSAY